MKTFIICLNISTESEKNQRNVLEKCPDSLKYHKVFQKSHTALCRLLNCVWIVYFIEFRIIVSLSDVNLLFIFLSIDNSFNRLWKPEERSKELTMRPTVNSVLVPTFNCTFILLHRLDFSQTLLGYQSREDISTMKNPKLWWYVSRLFFGLILRPLLITHCAALQ